MDAVNATELKNRLGAILARAELDRVAIKRHGRIVAYLVPARQPAWHGPRRARHRGVERHEEERLVRLCASGDLRPSRWMRAGDRRLLAGVATMLASQPGFPRMRLLALAERLHPGMSTPEGFARWLETAPVKAARLMPMVRAEMRHAK
jgi:antitoxin (DNA-binding transcriptional repressor) of toxin-antitoxin stability system